MDDAEKRRLVLLVALAAALKLAYALEYAAVLPFFEAPIFDSSIYLHQAAQVRAGEFSDPVFIAFSPLYGYFLALFGQSGVVVAQLFLGLVNLLIVYALVRRMFDPWAAFVSGMLYTSYGFLLFFETKVMSETLGLSLGLAAFALYLSPGFVRGRWREALAAGLLLGLAVLCRGNLLYSGLFFGLIAVVSWSLPPVPAKWRFMRASWFALGVGILLTVNGLWNLYHLGHFVPVRRWDGELSALTDDAGQVNAWDFVDRAGERVEDVSGSDVLGVDLSAWEPGELLANAPGRILDTFSDKETTHQYGYYGERTTLRALQILPVTFGTLLILGVFGALVLARRDGWRALLPYLPFVLGAIATSVFNFPTSRYRMVMVLPLVVLAGPGVMDIVTRGGARRRYLLGGATLLVCGLLSIRTLTYELSQPGMWHVRLATSDEQRGDVDSMHDHLDRAIALEPDNHNVRVAVERMRGGHAPRVPDE
jgi:4-amino-4-deoxy-L-arabinose transferase-like glycosyltransferase